MTDNKPRTIVEFVDITKHDVGHKAGKVRINGTEVLVEADTIALTFGNHEITKIALTLLPTEVHFIHDAPEPERPLQVGDTVFVPAGATYQFGDGQHSPTMLPVPCHAVITTLRTKQGNLTLSYQGKGAYNVSPDQVTRVVK